MKQLLQSGTLWFSKLHADMMTEEVEKQEAERLRREVCALHHCANYGKQKVKRYTAHTHHLYAAHEAFSDHPYPEYAFSSIGFNEGKDLFNEITESEETVNEEEVNNMQMQMSVNLGIVHGQGTRGMYAKHFR
eukprot:13582171-Ditylum_brightwellii.AAC.2